MGAGRRDHSYASAGSRDSGAIFGCVRWCGYTSGLGRQQRIRRAHETARRCDRLTLYSTSALFLPPSCAV
jgi:hypothetical protein